MNMKKTKKLLSIILTLCMVLTLPAMTALAVKAPVIIGTTGYGTLTAALAAAADGNVIRLNDSITESVTYAVYADKTITIDGGGFTLTGTAATNAALALNGTGTVILKDLTVQGGNSSSGTSEGLDVSGSVSVQSYGTVTANGGTVTSSYGATNQGTGTVDVTATSATGMQLGFGAYNTGSGTINVGTATGSGAMNGVGAYNAAGGTINVTTASGSRDGVTNVGSGTVNVTTAISTDATFGGAIYNASTGTVNAGAADGAQYGVINTSTGTVNAGTIAGAAQGTGINTGTAVTAIPLHVGTGASCVLNSITIAKSGSTIGTLPDVYKGSECSAEWYTGIALANLFTMQEISGEATLYSSFYTIETAEDVAAYITEEVTGLTTSVNGSTVTVTGTATATSMSDAALTLEIPSGVTVVWGAALSGGGSKYLLELTGDGTFEVAAGADISTACQGAIYCWNGKGDLNVTGGKVSTTGAGMAIGVAGDWLLTMTGGEVAANEAGSCAIFGRNSVVITGGTVSAAGTGGYQLYMSETSVYRGSVLDPGKIMYHTSGVFAEVCADAAVTQAVYGTDTGLTVTGHNMSTGGSMTAVWAKQDGESGVTISYYLENGGATEAVEEWFLSVPGVTVTDTGSPTDSISPAVTSVTPSGTGAPINGNIAITFSEPINTVSGVVYLSSDGGSSYSSELTGGSWSVSDSVYTVPYFGLSYNTAYTIKIEDFKDTAGNVMSADTSHSFTTMAGPSAATYTVTFDLAGGTRTGGGELTQTVAQGSAATAPTAIRSGYTFTGWDKNFSNVSESMTVTALWTYDSNSGSNPPAWPNSSTLTASGTTKTRTALNWTPAADDVGVTGYRIYQDHSLLLTVTGAVFSCEVTGLLSSTTYTFQVQAGDADNNWTYGPTVTVRTDSSEGGGGGGSSAPAPEPEPAAQMLDSNGNTSKTISIKLDNSTGTATIEADAASLTAAFDKSKADGKGVKAVEVDIPEIDGARAYETILPASFLTSGDSMKAIEIKTGIASVTASGNMINSVNGGAAQNVSLTIAAGDKGKLDAGVQAKIGDRPVIELSLKIDGKQTSWSNENAPVTVTIPYTPTAEELANPEGIIIWYIDGSGNAVSVPNGHYDPATGSVTFSTTHFSYYAVGYNKVSFSDVAASAWYNKAVGFIAARGITTGTGNGNYSPEAKLTRGEFLVMMMRACGIAPDESPKDNFTDAGSTYYTNYLAAAKRLGITEGVGNNMFAPGKEISRQEMFTLLYNALKVIKQLPQGDSGKSLSSFSDADDIASWAKEAMALLVETGTIGGYAGRLSPGSTTTRAEMAQVIYNLISK